jgi:hypothetical protein
MTVAARALRSVVAVLAAVTFCVAQARAEPPPVKQTFPRLMGMNIGKKNYQDPVYLARLARLDVVILDFFRGWNPTHRPDPIRHVVHRLKLLNPHILVGQYTILRESQDGSRHVSERDKGDKLSAENWWLRKADGTRVQWTDRWEAWDVNFMEWTKPDAQGRRYPEWLAERDFRLFFAPVPEFDIWYVDNINSATRIPWADWDLDGRDERGDSPRVEAAYRRGQVAHWRAIRRLAPGRLLMGNAGSDLSYPEYKGQLNAAFHEGLMGHSWSLERVQGWRAMMQRYQTSMRNTAAPHIVGFGIAGRRDDYRLFRYGFTSCLLDDGYFSFNDIERDYSSVVWFDEYDVDLGRAVSPPATAPWRNGVYRRDFEHGIVLVNPTDSEATLEIEPGFRHIDGRQDADVNNGKAVNTVRLPPRDGVVLIRGGAEQSPT